MMIMMMTMTKNDDDDDDDDFASVSALKQGTDLLCLI